MKSRVNARTLSFMGIYWFYWFGVAVYLPYLVPYLKSCGYNEIQIGILSSSMSVVSIAGPIFWGAVSDRRKRAKGILVVNLLAGFAIVQLVPAISSVYGLLIALLAVMYATALSQTGVMDGWVMRQNARGAGINYGLARGMGSLAYAVSGVISGVVLTKFGLRWMFPILLGVQCVTALLILRIKPQADIAGADVSAAEVESVPETPLYRNTPYIIFLLLATLLYIGNTSTMSFYWILLQSAGGTPENLGLATGIMALSEFPIMFLSSRLLKRYKDTTLLLVAMGFYVVRIFLFYSMQSVTGLVWAQATNSLSFGIFLPTSVHYISRITPGRTKATALSLASSMYMGLGGIIGNLAGGFVIDAYGVRALYGGAAVLAAVVTVAFGVVLLVSRKKSPLSPERNIPTAL